MTTKSSVENIVLMRRAFQALQRHDVDACVEMLSADFVINIAGMPTAKRGTGAWRSHAQMLLTAFPDVQLSVEDIFAADDRIAVRLRLSGTHRGEFMGIRPTGRRITYDSTEVYRIQDGRIAEEWICSDTLTLLTQLGGVSSTRLAAMYLSGHRFWLGAGCGILAGLLVRQTLKRPSTTR